MFPVFTSLRRVSLLVIVAWSVAPLPAQTPGDNWKVGVATRKLTPEGPVWMAGYANRTVPSTGVDLDLFAKALLVQDAQDRRMVIVTLDLIGVPRSLRIHVERECGARFGLKPQEILLNAS